MLTRSKHSALSEAPFSAAAAASDAPVALAAPPGIAPAAELGAAVTGAVFRGSIVGEMV